MIFKTAILQARSENANISKNIDKKKKTGIEL